MELKTNYQYTYFIHPFIIRDGKYKKYILKMLKNKNCSLKIFQKEKDYKLYKYFLPEVRKFLFSSFSFANEKLSKLQELPVETRAALLAKYPCNIFEYTLKKDIQGKVEDKNGIFFGIQKIEVICFNTGICFLAIKTNIEQESDFSSVLNFNYKFRDINNETSNLNSYDNIKIQTDAFSNVEKLQDFIYSITGANLNAAKLEIDTERFLTYSYTCIDQEGWNSERSFENVRSNFTKYAEILANDDIRNINYDKIETFSKWKYAKMCIKKLVITLFSSIFDMNNYTILPDEYENQYFYTYILNLYKKIYLKKIELEFRNLSKVKKARNKFIEFTKKLWIQEVTDDETGTLLNNKMNDVFELDKMYLNVKNKYDVLYKELNIEKDRKTTGIITFILIVSLLFNILNFILLFNR